MTDKEIVRHKQWGRQAYENGLDARSNPFIDGTDESALWAFGYSTAHTEDILFRDQDAHEPVQPDREEWSISWSIRDPEGGKFVKFVHRRASTMEEVDALIERLRDASVIIGMGDWLAPVTISKTINF